VTLTFDIGIGAECQPWHAQPLCPFWCFCDFVVDFWANTHQVDDWCSNLDLWGHHTSAIRIPSLNFVGLPISKIWLIISHIV